jgi:hypothetical protein
VELGLAVRIHGLRLIARVQRIGQRTRQLIPPPEVPGKLRRSLLRLGQALQRLGDSPMQ